MPTNRRPYQLPEPLLCDPERVRDGVSMTIVEEYRRRHEARLPRYDYLENLYRGFHDVYRQPEKEHWKPDNRLAVNFPRYITDTFLGYACGIPIKKSHPDGAVNEALRAFEQRNEITDHEFELAKRCCIYGHAWEYFYQDERAETCLAACSPKELFCVYDDTVRTRALFAVRYGVREDGYTHFGEILTREEIAAFEGGRITGRAENPYGRIPAVEWQLNAERMGLFEEVSGLVEAYNHTIAEKANDVDAFAEAYLVILGAELDEEGVYRIRDNRIINLYGTDNAKDILVQFLTKPTADGTQESLLDRLERLIYQTSMVANLSDESFGSAASGVSLAYKLQAMSNLALTFDRKIEKSLRKRYKLWSGLATNVPDPEAWREVRIQTARNLPKNRLEEAQTAQAMEGLVSRQTQLGVLSVVEDPAAELAQIDREADEAARAADRRSWGA